MESFKVPIKVDAAPRFDPTFKIIELLEQICNKTGVMKRDTDTLSAKEIEKQYNINYAKVLKCFNDPRLNVMDDIKPKLVMRCEWERYLKKIYNIKE